MTLVDHGAADRCSTADGVRPRRVDEQDGPTPANIVVALAFAVVRNHEEHILLARRADTGNWELPGGRIEPGESISRAATREVAEETGVVISVSGLAGVFCDPGLVVLYPDTGEARQQHATLVHAVPTIERPAVPRDTHEIDAVIWLPYEHHRALTMHPSVRHRLALAQHHHLHGGQPHCDL